MNIKKFRWLIFSIITILVFGLTLNNNIVKANDINKIYLGGQVAGFNINTEGAKVVGLTDVITNKGRISPCKNAGVKVDDIIISMNNTKINSATDINEVLKNYKNGFIVTKLKRNGLELKIDIFPEKDLTGHYKLGVFLRDDLMGIGTITYIKGNGNFGALGHPVCDEKGKTYNIVGGNVYNCAVVGVNKSQNKKAGELKGMFIGENPIGELKSNQDNGIFGYINDLDFSQLKEIEIGNAKIGRAEIVSTIDGVTSKTYKIDIVKTDSKNSSNKNLVIKVTDKELLSYTGGILQGMSGSPIVQNGKLVGAVTHVFINDSSRGYGISIENMMKE